MRTAGSRRMRARALLAVAAAASLALAGCSDPADPSPTGASADAAPDPTTTPSPTALTEEEALAIAVETYEAYLSATGDVLESGDAAVPSFKATVTEEFGAPQLETLLERSQTEDLVAEGQITVVKSELQKLTPETIDVYLCTDASQAVIYERGSVPEETREQSIFALEVRLVNVNGSFRVDKSETWDEPEFCSDLS